MNKINLKKAKVHTIKPSLQEESKDTKTTKKKVAKVGGIRSDVIAKCTFCRGNPVVVESTVSDMKITYCNEMPNGQRCMEVVKWEKI